MRLKAHLALLSVALIYGANYTIAKNVLDQDYLKPNGFILLRVISGFVLFTILHALFIREKVDRKDFGLLAICGLFGIAINQLFFFKVMKKEGCYNHIKLSVLKFLRKDVFCFKLNLRIFC